jgi:hypothetical protein
MKDNPTVYFEKHPKRKKYNEKEKQQWRREFQTCRKPRRRGTDLTLSEVA